MTSFLCFSGSTRQDSFNQKTATALASIINESGETASVLNLIDYEMPIYQGDLEAESGLPDGTLRLKKALDNADALVIVCPEYNGYMPPVLINAIDWCTRSADASVDLACFVNKPVFVAAASPGPGGGGRAAIHLKTMLSGIGSFVSPFPLTLPAAFQAFDDSGRFSDDNMQSRADRMMSGFIEFAKKLS